MVNQKKIELITVKHAMDQEHPVIEMAGLMAVRFTLNNGDFIDVSFTTHQEERVPGDSISIRGINAITISPRASNAVLITVDPK